MQVLPKPPEFRRPAASVMPLAHASSDASPRMSLRPTLALAVAGLALLTGGCAVPPPRAQLATVATPEKLGASQSLAPASGASAANWPSDGWWQAYGDSQLDSLIAEGLAGATDLRVAQARFAKAQAVAGESRSALLPSLTAGAQGGLTQQSNNYLFPQGMSPRGWPDYGQASLSLSWDLDFWGKNRAALSAAKSDAAAAGAEAAATRLTVSAGIASAYADLASLFAQRDAAVDAVEVRQKTRDLMADRQRQGLENMGAVERAVSSLETAQGDLASLDESIGLARNRIAALMGAGPDRGLAIARPQIDLGKATAGLPANLPAELIGRRPDVIAAKLRVQSSDSRIRQARAAFYPSVNLSALIGMQALDIGKVFQSGSDYGSVGPALSLPILDGGRLRAQYRGTEADHEVAVAQYDAALVQALHDVADAATSQQALGQRLGRAQAAQASAQAAWTVANNRYRGGLATYLDVLNAEDSLIAARKTVASLQTRAFALDVAMVRALGGGFRS
ncbi:efflux transporter outer membrane subunit [Novosphingobium sp. SG720]|uniref:efflux transporter outer membrane subunit n=1 Tax=Novosphingobium sp. SG720 TaxID=2586998 RepID=UPI0017EE3F94|nr:efflux transporter outer membrane subunit [Novosphingobium sp. SG720]NKJ43959.1 NodT family efflux transporter outer membrane factor (OMF) lipoprotein [Novosphingobium sp. SG720]